MKNLFLLALKLTESIVAIQREGASVFTFKRAEINLESIKMEFVTKQQTLRVELSIHHLDTPWNLKLTIQNQGSEIKNINAWLANKNQLPIDSILSVNPRILKDENQLDLLALDVQNNIRLFLSN